MIIVSLDKGMAGYYQSIYYSNAALSSVDDSPGSFEYSRKPDVAGHPRARDQRAGAIHRSTTQSLTQLSFLFCLILFPSARRCCFKSSYALSFLQLHKLLVYLDCPSHPLAALSSHKTKRFRSTRLRLALLDRELLAVC